MKILLIGNDADAKRVRTLLEAAPGGSYSVDHAATLSTGADLAGTGSYEAILLDPNMPDGEGLAALERITKAAPGAPIVIVSDEENLAFAEETVRRGAQSHLIKSHLHGFQLRFAIHVAIQRKRYEESLERAQQHFVLVQRLEAIGRLAGGVAHDFNNILTSVIGYTELLLDRMTEGDPNRKTIEEINRAGMRMADLTKQLLAFGRRQIMQPKVMDLNAETVELLPMLKRLVGKDVEISTALEPKLGRTKADPSQIEQVLINLFMNAREAMPSGGKLTIETSNVFLDEEYAKRHVAGAPGPYVRLVVSDTGRGMDPETQAHIFEPFFTTKPKGAGTGLGLSTVYGIVKQSGGFIWVYSERGKGATFKMYLPEATEAGEPAPASSPSRPAGGETVLLAEDEDGVRALAGEVLKAKGYRVLAAGNGEEALEISGKHPGPVDLLLTDVVMPRMGGRELADRLGKLRPGLKVLFMSGYTENAIVHNGVLEAGIQFLEKPFTPSRLAEKVRAVLDSPAKK